MDRLTLTPVEEALSRAQRALAAGSLANMLLAVTYGDSDREAANAAYARAVEANPGSLEALNGFFG